MWCGTCLFFVVLCCVVFDGDGGGGCSRCGKVDVMGTFGKVGGWDGSGFLALAAKAGIWMRRRLGDLAN